MGTRTIIGMLGLVLAAGCTSSASSPVPDQVSTGTNDDGLRLTLRLPMEQAVAGEAIPFTTTLEYLGPNDAAQIDGAGGELVVHGLRQDVGTAYGPWSINLDCSTYELKRGEVRQMPLVLTIDVPEEDPNRSAIEESRSDGSLRLPAGRWAIDAAVRYYPERGCGGPERWIGATVWVDVS